MSPGVSTDRRERPTSRLTVRLASPLAVLVALVMALLLPVFSAPVASADDCPDVQVVYARGTFEPPGVGATGQAFVDSLRADLPNKSLDVYAVDYPASLDFARAADGVVDASNEVQDVAGRCPRTKMVLLCITDDPVCSPGGRATGVHSQYAVNGMTCEAATFATKRVLGT